MLLYSKLGEAPTESVDPSDLRSRRARYRAAAKFRDGSELGLTGEANALGNEAHRVAQIVQDWLGDQKVVAPAD